MKSLKLLGLATFVIHVPSRAFTVLDTRDQHGNAAIIIDNPAGVTYRALLPDSPTSRIRGSISGTSSPDGIGVQFIINLSGLPGQSEGPLGRPTLPSPSPYTWLIACRDRPDLAYHVHDQPLGTDGNCAAALAHHDPYRRSEKPLCDPSHPATCQVGDLSGKHGNITGSSYSTKYIDLYESTKPGIGAFFGNRSIVLHSKNGTRLTCANFSLAPSILPTSAKATPQTGTTNPSLYPSIHAVPPNTTLSFRATGAPRSTTATVVTSQTPSLASLPSAFTTTRSPVHVLFAKLFGLLNTLFTFLC